MTEPSPFLVVPKYHNGGRQVSYEIIDTGEKAERMRLGYFNDEHVARSVAAVLGGAQIVYRKELHHRDQNEPF